MLFEPRNGAGDGWAARARRWWRAPGLAWLGALILSCGCAHAAAKTGSTIDTAKSTASLDTELTQLLADEQVSGATYALVVDGEVRLGAVGVAHVPTAAPLTTASKVHVGSLTKTVLALAALRLATQKKLELDAPVQRYLPGLPFGNPWQATSPVRVRHLLDHTAGLEDLRLWHAFSARSSPDMPLAEAVERDPAVLQLRTEPGTRCSYSNLGYTVLAMVIEAIVGERYEAWAEHALLKPLGLKDSSLRFVTQVGIGGDPLLAWGHHDDLQGAAALPIAVRPAGQFTTTAPDMAQLARFLMGDGRLVNDDGGEPFIAPALLRAMGQPTTTDAVRAGLSAGYALGLSTRDRHGVNGLCHAGSVIGYRGMLCLFPRQQRAFFIAINTDSETAKYDRFDAALIRQLGLSGVAPVPGRATLGEEWAGRYLPAPSRFEPLRLLDALGGGWLVHAGSNDASLARAGAAPVPLLQVAGALYRQADRVAPSHIFIAGGDGERYLSDGLRTSHQVSSLWFYALWISVAFGAAGLLFSLLATPVRRARRGTSLGQPAFVATLLLLLPLPLFPLQPMAAIGDFTLASGTLHVVMLLLPLLMLLQIGWSRWLRSEGWRLDIAAAVAVLQFVLLLACWGLWPVMLWR